MYAIPVLQSILKTVCFLLFLSLFKKLQKQKRNATLKRIWNDDKQRNLDGFLSVEKVSWVLKSYTSPTLNGTMIFLSFSPNAFLKYKQRAICFDLHSVIHLTTTTLKRCSSLPEFVQRPSLLCNINIHIANIFLFHTNSWWHRCVRRSAVPQHFFQKKNPFKAVFQ